LLQWLLTYPVNYTDFKEPLFYLSLLIDFGTDYSIMKKYLVLLLMAIVSMGWAQEHHGGPVKWMTFEQAVEKSKTEKRKIFIDVYTDWCGWCKVMDKNTFSEPTIAGILNEKFYPVKFDAEQRGDIIFSGTTFKFIPQGNGGVHQLAAALLNNQLSYPTVVFLDEEFRMISPIPGYQKPDAFHQYLTYYSEDYHKKGEDGPKDFKKNYKSPYPETAPANNEGGH